MGHVGYRVVRLLLSLGERVSVITAEPNGEWIDALEGRAKVIIGDARNRRLLDEAGLSEARAVLALTNSDLANIEIALDVKRARPEIPVVVRLFDQKVARQIESTFDIRRSMAMSSLAAPNFVGAIVGETIVGTFRANGELYVIGESIADQRLSGMRRDEIRRSHGLSLLGCGDGTQLRVNTEDAACEGERLLLLGSAAAWDNFTTTPSTVGTRRNRGVGWVLSHYNPRVWFRVLRSIWKNAPLPLRIAFGLLLTFFAACVLIYHSLMDLSLVDSFYFVGSTVTTVGYGDISPRNSTALLKILAVVLMILGSASLAVLYSIITDFIVTSRLEQLAGTQLVPLQDHTVVVGLGNVGYRIVEELRDARAEVVALERNGTNDFVEAVRPDVPVIVGDARARETLSKVSIETAAAVVAATDDDMVNLAVALAAKELNPRIRTVVRFFDGEFARKIEGKLNVDIALSAAEIAAPNFVASALAANARVGFVSADRFVILTEGEPRLDVAREDAELHRGIEGELSAIVLPLK